MYENLLDCLPMFRRTSSLSTRPAVCRPRTPACLATHLPLRHTRRRSHHLRRSASPALTPRRRLAPSPRHRSPFSPISIHTFSWALLRAPTARRCPPLCGPARHQIYKHALSPPPPRPPSSHDPWSRSAAVRATAPRQLAASPLELALPWRSISRNLRACTRPPSRPRDAVFVF